MAVNQQGNAVIGRAAHVNLQGDLFCFVSMDGTTGEIVLASAAAAVVGVLIEENNSASAPYGPVTVQLDGIAKVVAGGTISAGAQVEVDSSAHAVTHASGIAVGVALTHCSSGDVVEIKLY